MDRMVVFVKENKSSGLVKGVPYNDLVTCLSAITVVRLTGQILGLIFKVENLINN